MKHKVSKQFLSVLLALVMVIGLIPPSTLTAMARTVIPVEPDGGMNLRVDETGKLLWDSVAGATGYKVDVCKHPGDFLLTTDSVGAGETSYALFSKLDDLGFDNGTYRVKMNVSGSDPEYTYSTLLFYYDSPYEKLSAPANLRWNGNTAEWDAVPNADYYNVYICNTTTTGSLSVRSHLTGTSVDLSYLSPQAGWYFEVIAYGAGYRNSAVSESPRKDGGSRTIIPVSGNGAMNLKLLENGMLLWDKYDDATSYTINIYEHPGNFVLKTINVDKANQYCELIDAMDEERYDNGDYRIEVRANGSSAEHPYDSMIIYYDSPYTKLTTPGNPHWNGLFASWDAVPGAQYYNVYVNDTTTGSLNVKSHVEETFVALTDFDPQPGWYFEVIAYGSGYRHSAAGVSPRKGFIVGADTYDASEDELYSGGKVKVETEAGSHDYDYIGESFEVSNDSEVAMTALPDDGYEFVEWRIGSETGESFSKAKSIGFRADKSMHLYAVFHKSFPEGTGTINNPVVCSTYEEMKYALEHPTVQGIVVNSFTNDPYQTFYTLEKEKDFKAGHCAITIPANSTKYLTINADINIRVPYIDYLLYSFIDNRGSLTVGGTGSLNVSMNARGYPSAIIYNNGELNIGGNVTFDPTNHSFDSVHGYSVFTANGHAVINSGTFIGYDASAVSYYGGCLDIYGGTFKVKNGDEQAFGLNADSYLSVAEHNVNLYGGTFDGIRAEQSIGENIAKLPDLLGYGAYYTYTSDGSKFDPSGKLDTHETLTVKMNNIVHDVALTVTAPKEGSKPSYTVGCASDAYYAVGGNNNYTNYQMWMESDDGENNWREMDINDVFITGKYYKFVVDIKTASGNMFPLYDNGSSIVPDVSATINGYYARVIKAYDQDPSTYITVEYNFGMCNDDVVENITITNIDAPVAGQTPDYTANCFGTGYSMAGTNSGNWKVNGIVWLRDGNIYTGSIMDNTEKFQPGHEYTVMIDLVADYGYTFLFNHGNSIYAAAAINGNTAQINIDCCSTTEYQVWYTFTCAQAEVSAVEVSGIDAPVAGQTPDYTGTVGNAALYGFANYGYNAAGFWWYDSEDKPLTSEDKFVAGETYKLEIKLTSAMIDQVAASRFKTPVTATLNGKAVDSSDVMANSSTVYIYQTYTCKEASAVFVSGSVTSFNDASGDITLQLIPEGLSEPAYETIVTGNTVDYYFADVAAGTYTLRVMKKNHVTREYTVVVGNSFVIQDVYLCLLGDVNEDGLLNSADYSMIVAHVKCNVVFDDVQKSAADLTRDGVVDAFDAIYLDLYLNGAVELP